MPSVPVQLRTVRPISFWVSWVQLASATAIAAVHSATATVAMPLRTMGRPSVLMAGEACHSSSPYLRDMTNHRGSCLCGEVAYEVEGALEHAHHCHCTYCRKAHGTPAATGAMARGRRWLRGEQSVAHYESSPGFQRYFCARCGSALPGDPSAGFSFIDFGTLDGDPGVRPAFHMFVASKAPWWKIRDGLRAFDGFPPGIDAEPVADRPLRDAPGTPR